MKSTLRQVFIFFIALIAAVLLAGSTISGDAAAQLPEIDSITNEVQAEPIISVWYGDNQIFGVPGLPQRQINILGNVRNTTTLTYQLNGGEVKSLSIGSDARRLYNPGDFVIDLMDSELLNGSNTLLITAYGSNTVTHEVNFTYTRNQIWPEIVDINWNTGSIQTLAQIVDGKWELTPEGIRTTEIGYDRLIAIGDMGWRDYEVVANLTIHSKDDAGFEDPSYGPAVGVLMRWTGHTDKPVICEQPKCGWQPFGTIAWYRWLDPEQPDKGQLYLYMNSSASQYASPSKQLSFGTPYIFKVRVETLVNGQSIYKFKVWQQGDDEPDSWDVFAYDRGNEYATGDPSAGSILLLAHHVDVTFGDVSVSPLGNPLVLMGTSDDFNACEISTGVWEWVDPTGTASYAVNNPYGGNAQASITIPIGEVQSINPPINNAPRLVQTVGDGNFQIEVKFDTPLNGNSVNFKPVQGILLESMDGNRWMRTELFSQGGGIKLRVFTHERSGLSTWVNTLWLDESVASDGITPVYLKVQRYGSRYLISYKVQDNAWIDRINIPLHMLAGKAGIYAGNSAITPSPSSHTFVVDYVQLNSQPFFQPDEVKNDLTVNVSGRGTVDVQPEQDSYSCGQTVLLTANPQERWEFTGWEGDISGNESVSQVFMDKPKFINASFIQKEFVVNVSTLGMGEVHLRPNKETFISGEEVTIEAVPHSGWYFYGWGGNVVGEENPVSISIESDVTIVAIFETRNRVYLPFVIR